MSKAQVQEVASFTPRGWEKKVRQLLVEAQNAGTIEGWWRDKDRSNSQENKRRMAGKLDFEVYPAFPFPSAMLIALPHWKRLAIGLAPTTNPSFTLYLEAKTGKGVPNAAQEVSIERANRNPGAHAFVVYPTDLGWLRKVLGI